MRVLLSLSLEPKYMTFKNKKQSNVKKKKKSKHRK